MRKSIIYNVNIRVPKGFSEAFHMFARRLHVPRPEFSSENVSFDDNTNEFVYNFHLKGSINEERGKKDRVMDFCNEMNLLYFCTPVLS